MDAERDLRALANELAELERARAADRAEERRNALVTRAVAAGLLLIVAAFALVNYRHFQREWTEEKLEASLRHELDTLNVEATVHLDALGQQLLPVYADESLRQFQELSPEIARRFVEQFERVGVDLQMETHAQLVETEERIRQRTAALLFETFPELEQDATRAQVEGRLHRATEAAVGEAIGSFDARFGGDVEELQSIVMSFDVSDTEEPTVELQKRFLRCWLQLLDKEIAKL